MESLETDRLTLREYTLDDAPIIVELLNEPSFIRFIADKGVRTLDDARDYLATVPLASYARHGYGLYHVATRDDDTPVGMCGLVRREELDHPDIGFAFLEAHQRRGYAVEAAAAVLADGRDRLGLGTIVAITSPDNARSAAVLEKLGMRLERRIVLPGERGETLLFSTTRATR